MEAFFNSFIIAVDLYVAFKNIQLLDWIYEGKLPQKLRPIPARDLVIHPKPMDLYFPSYELVFPPKISELVTYVTQPNISTRGMDLKYPEDGFEDMSSFFGTSLSIANTRNTIIPDVIEQPPEGATAFQFRGNREGPNNEISDYKAVVFQVPLKDKNSISYRM